MRKASLGTLFLTVFLDLLGFGLVIPFLPGVARELGASDFVATAIAGIFSAMQFLFIPLWGRLSDRVGRRPVLLWSIAASAVGMALLGVSTSLAMLVIARAWSGIATANIAVAQAYIADVTTPETRAKGMGIIGMGFGLGFIFGPFLGGLFSQFDTSGHEGRVAAFVAAGLSLLNFVLAFFSLPESHPPERRGKGEGIRRSPFDFGAVRRVVQYPGLAVAIAITFSVTFWFSGLEVTFRLFTEDAFGMTTAGTGYLFGFVGVVAVIVQGGLIHRLSRRFGEVRLIRAGLFALAMGFLLDGVSPDFGLGVLLLGSAAIAFGNGLYTPSLSSYSSRQTGPEAQGLTLGVVQSMGALARVTGPLVGGLSYQYLGMRAPYFLGALGVLVVALLAFRLPPIARKTQPAPVEGGAAAP
jgi:MFS transporter, DHA1 family, tetracycline resistance protein